jgi:hypothetical protein
LVSDGDGKAVIKKEWSKERETVTKLECLLVLLVRSLEPTEEIT